MFAFTSAINEGEDNIWIILMPLLQTGMIYCVYCMRFPFCTIPLGSRPGETELINFSDSPHCVALSTGLTRRLVLFRATFLNSMQRVA
jgi:hypothetical protein